MAQLETSVQIWDPNSGELLRTLSGHTGSVWSVAFDRGGRRLLSMGGDGARVWDVESGQLLLTLRGPAGVDVGAAFSPDGHLIGTVGRDGVTKLWDASNGQALLTLAGPGPGEGLSGLAFSPDGRYLATGGDLAVRSYMVHIDDLVSLVRSRLTRSLTREECQQYLHQEQCPD